METRDVCLHDVITLAENATPATVTAVKNFIVTSLICIGLGK